MRGTRRSGRLIGAPSENEDMNVHLPILQRATFDRLSREGTSRDPRRSVEESRRGVVQSGMSGLMREREEDDQSREGGFGMSGLGGDMGESQGGTQASRFVPPQYPPYQWGAEYPMRDTSELPRYHPYPTFMPYPPFYPPYPPSYPQYLSLIHISEPTRPY